MHSTSISASVSKHFLQVFPILVVSLLLLTSQTKSHAQQGTTSLKVVTFNLAWAGTQAQYTGAFEVCEKTQWCDTRPPKVATYKLLQDRDICEAVTLAAWGSKGKRLAAPPCNAYDFAQVFGIKTLERKNALLGSTIKKLVTLNGTTDPTSVLAFQEVSSAAALKEIFGVSLAADFHFCEAPSTQGFQNVAFAWHKSLGGSPSESCKEELPLAVSEGDRKLRPGLQLNLNIGTRVLSLLNLHLKSSCANAIPSERYPARLLTDNNDPACRALSRQVKPLEDWIEKVSGLTPYFVVLGDFNRRIDEELLLNSLIGDDKPFGSVRTDKTSPSSPHTVRAKKPKPEDEISTTRFLWQELSDSTPAATALVQVPLKSSQECEGFPGLDHVVLSHFLSQIQLPQLASVKIAVDKGVTGSGKDDDKASDHCPRVTTIQVPKN